MTLIQAADKTPSVQRFIPSEFNVDYDLDDDVLPYPEKKFHTMARRALEKTKLEFTYIYNGMFMDYYAMPNIETHLRPLYTVVDASQGVAAIPGDGNRGVVMSYTKDVARYTSLILDIAQWPRVMKIMGSQATLNQLVHLIEQNLDRKLNKSYDPIERLQTHDATVLPSNEPSINHFPGGRAQLTALIADLGAAMALGAYDFGSIEDGIDVIKYFEGQTTSPLTLEELMESAWKGR